jgi:hypothetical protein
VVRPGHDVHTENTGDNRQDSDQQAETAKEHSEAVEYGCSHGVPPSVQGGFVQAYRFALGI